MDADALSTPALLLALVLLAAAAGCQSSHQLCPGGQPNCCHSTDDCDSASICFPADGFGCEIQAPLPGTPTCVADSDCAAAGGTYVCEQVECQPMYGMNCVSGCALDADCAEGEACSATHHCVPAACGGGCPPLFACDTASSFCFRRTCTGDGDCPAAGVCVDGACHAALGQCGLII